MNTTNQIQVPHTPFDSFLQITCKVWLCILITLLLFSAVQLIGFWTYSTQYILKLYSHDIMHSLLLARRFDLQSASYAFLPFYLIGIMLSVFPKSRITNLYSAFLYYVALLILTLFLLISLVNFYYYKAFGASFNYQLFTIGEGNLKVNLITIWQDYPVVLVLLIAGVFVLLLALFLKRFWSIIDKIEARFSFILQIILVILLLLVYGFVGLRGGSLSLFPTRIKQADFSTNHLINQLTANAPTMLLNAIQERHTAEKPLNVSLDEGRTAYNNFFNANLKPNTFRFASFFTHTKKNRWLEEHKPNVVFVQMEGMGNHFLNFNNQKTDNLLGKLAPFYKRGSVFRYFLSDSNGTASTLAHFFVNSPTTAVFNAPLSRVSYQSSIALPYKKAGYETVFISGDYRGWEHLDTFLRRQGFDKVLGEYAILQRYPNAKKEGWGVYDQYTFQYASFLLKEAYNRHKPIFIYINTVTNHPPYKIPDDYKPLPAKLPKDIAKFMHIPRSKAKMMLLTYQYANNALGQFINDTTNTLWGPQTIIAASGDHNQHEMMPNYTNPHLKFLQRSVPFILHVPAAYLRGWRVDPNRIGSHKDIFPTLFNLSLSNATYENSGDNLLSGHKRGLVFGVNDAEILIPQGVIVPSRKPQFYPWIDKKEFKVGLPRSLTQSQRLIYNRIINYKRLMRWQFEWQAWHTLQNNTPRSSVSGPPH